MGQLVIELSSAFLTAALRNMIGRLLPCPTGPLLYTDVEISQVTAVRGDDRDQGLQQMFANLEIDPTETRRVSTHFNPLGIDLPERVASTFLLVTGSMRLVPSTFADSSETQPSWEFKFGAVGGGAFLFRIARIEALGSSVSIHLGFEGLTSESADARLDLLPGEVRNRLNNIQISVSLADLFSVFQISPSIWNPGVAAQNAGRDHGSLRLAIDMGRPQIEADWITFHAFPGDSALIAEELWGAFLSKALIEEWTLALIAPWVNVPGLLISDKSVSWDGNQIQFRCTISTSDLNAILGNGSVSGKPFIKNEDPGFGPDGVRSFLTFKMCADADVDIAQVLTSPIGASAGPIAIIAWAVTRSQMKSRIRDALATADPFALYPAALKIKTRMTASDSHGCREFGFEIDVPFPGVGSLRLARVTPHAKGLQLGGWVAHFEGAKSIGKLGMKPLQPWRYPWSPCHPPESRNPWRTIVLLNTGDLPLNVCEATQIITDSKSERRVVRVFDSTRKKLMAFPAIIEPGKNLTLQLKANLLGPIATIKTNIIFQIVSTGGCRKLDLNPDGKLTPLTQEEFDELSGYANALCEVVNTSQSGWQRPRGPGWGYTDPVPFSVGDIVRERLTITARGLRAGAQLNGFVGKGLRQVRAATHNGTAKFSMSAARPASNSHSKSKFSLTGLDRAKGQVMTDRVLYRELRALCIGQEVLGVGQKGETLQLLVRNGLYQATLQGNSFTQWTFAAVLGATCFSDHAGGWIVGTEHSTKGFDHRFKQIWNIDHGSTSISVNRHDLWLATPTHVYHYVLRNKPRPTSSFKIQGARDLVAVTGGKLFALCGDRVWSFKDDIQETVFCATRLTRWEQGCAAETESGVRILGPNGNTESEYEERPWFIGLLEWPSLALEVQSGGRFIFYERFETPIDPETLPKGSRRTLNRKSRKR